MRCTKVVRLYKQMVRPHLEYAVQSWNPSLVRDKFLLEQVQRRATKLISYISELPYEQRLVRLGLTILELRRPRGISFRFSRLFMVLISLCSMIFSLCPITHALARRHGLKLHSRRSRLDVRKYFFFSRVVKEWNSLPEVVYAQLCECIQE